MRILIIGGTGLLGSAMTSLWTGHEILATGSKDLDIRSRDQIHDVMSRFRPDRVVLAAAFTDVDGCEKNPARATEVNGVGAENVAFVARQLGCWLALISTDYVFDGAKQAPYETEDPMNPISVYGRSKMEGEAAVRRILPDACIARTSWVFGNGWRCFPESILSIAAKQKEIEVVSDQIGCPTFNEDAAMAIGELVRGGVSGTVHVTNAGQCSRHELAKEILQAAGFGTIPVLPVLTDEHARPARRPKYSVLSAVSLNRLGIFVRPWREAVRDYVQKRANKASMVLGRGASTNFAEAK